MFVPVQMGTQPQDHIVFLITLRSAQIATLVGISSEMLVRPMCALAQMVLEP
jgi:hypothetical protein